MGLQHILAYYYVCDNCGYTTSTTTDARYATMLIPGWNMVGSELWCSKCLSSKRKEEEEQWLQEAKAWRESKEKEGVKFF